jgi:DNA-binding transcriptional ArsR family regulator
MVVALGGRIGAAQSIHDGIQRISLQVATCAIIIDSGEAATRAAFTTLLDAVEEEVQARRMSGVVSISPALIDVAMAHAQHPSIILLCDPSPAEKIAAIGAALAFAHLPAMLNDNNRDAVIPRLQQLSREASRIADALASFRRCGGACAAAHHAADDRRWRRARRPPPGRRRDGAHDDPRAAVARAVLRSRAFADPAWDMLLDLMAARLEGRQVAVSSLCIAAAVPPTTALRWIKTLTETGILERIADPQDGRRVFIRLSDAAAEAMGEYLAAAQRLGTPVL